MAGTYTLLIEGSYQDSASGFYQFNVVPAGNVAVLTLPVIGLDGLAAKNIAINSPAIVSDLKVTIASFAATPTRGTRIVVMGERGTLIAEQPGPNPMENGVVVASRDGAPLQPLPTPAQYTPFTDDRDPRLMAFRLLVRDFTKAIEQRTSSSPNFTDGLRCQEVLDAVRESSNTGRTVKLR